MIKAIKPEIHRCCLRKSMIREMTEISTGPTANSAGYNPS